MSATKLLNQLVNSATRRDAPVLATVLMATPQQVDCQLVSRYIACTCGTMSAKVRAKVVQHCCCYCPGTTVAIFQQCAAASSSVKAQVVQCAH
jgi:predicted thioesterase